MTQAAVIEAIRTEHPWVSVERCEDLMRRARGRLGPHALPFEVGRAVLLELEARWGPGDNRTVVPNA